MNKKTLLILVIAGVLVLGFVYLINKNSQETDSYPINQNSPEQSQTTSNSVTPSNITPSAQKQPSFSLFSSSGKLGGKTLVAGPNTVDSVTINVLPIYEIASTKLTGVYENASENNIAQETKWGNFTILQTEQTDKVLDAQGKVLYEKNPWWVGMFIDKVLTFNFNNKNYFILGGGDCGNKGCTYSYGVFNIDKSGNVKPIEKEYANDPNSDRSPGPLWMNGGSFTSDQQQKIYFVAGYNKKLLFFVKKTDGSGLHVLVLDEEDSLIKEFDTDGKDIKSIFFN